MRARANDSLALLNWGFRFYETHELYAEGAVVSTQRLWKGTQNTLALGVSEPLLVSTPRGRQPQLELSMDIPEHVIAPIAKGQHIGAVKVTLEGNVIAEQPLVALDAVEEAGFFGRLWDEIMMWLD